jgi:hypothetical protein
MISAHSTKSHVESVLKANMGRLHSFSSSLSLRVRHKLSGLRTSKQQTDTETANPHSNTKSTPNRQTDTETSNLPPNNKPTPNQRASSTLLDQTITMDELTLTHHPSELLHQVAEAMGGRHPELSVTVPRIISWKAALRAIDSALGEVDERMMVTYKRPEHYRQILRQTALQNVKDWSSSSLSAIKSPGLPIRTQYDINSLPMPKPASEEKWKKLKEDAMSKPIPYHPYTFSIRANIMDKTLPVVKANVRLRGVDHIGGDITEKLEQVDMIWDTGAHQTIITEDLLSESFREFLKDSRHDVYRSGDGLRLQMDAFIAFSNIPIDINAIVLVVPKSMMPNEHIGILFGQLQCIDCISYHSSPRRILQAKGEDIEEGVWGDIVIDGTVDFDDKLHSF